MEYVAALDQGSTSTRAVLYTLEGEEVASRQIPVSTSYPHPGWVEQDARELWDSASLTLAYVLAQARGPVRALGITNQRETVVAWDAATGEPLHPAISWQCRRTADRCEVRRREGKEEEIRARTGLLLDPYFSATKLEWLLPQPEVARAYREGRLRVGTVDSYLIYRLSGGRRHVTDASNASRTLLYHLEQGAWDPWLLAEFHVPWEILPEVVPSTGAVVAEVQPGQIPGLTYPIPIAGVAGDQQASLFALTAGAAGAKCTYGTGAFALVAVGERLPSRPGLLTTVAWQQGDRRLYALEGSVMAAGAVVDWLVGQLGLADSAAALSALAATVEDTAGVMVVPAWSGLGAPYWNPRARGAILGLTRAATRAHVARAALLGIALRVHDVLAAMAGDGPPQELWVDGGLARSDTLLQLQAEVLGWPVKRARRVESTALGAAALAGATLGLMDPGRVRGEPDAVWTPSADDGRRKAWLDAWQEAIRQVIPPGSSG